MAYINGKRALFGYVGKSGRGVLLDRLIPHIEPPPPPEKLGMALTQEHYDALGAYEEIYYVILGGQEQESEIYTCKELTQTEYDDTPHDAQTLYIIKDGDEIIDVLLGDQQADALYFGADKLWQHSDYPNWLPCSYDEIKAQLSNFSKVVSDGLYIDIAIPTGSNLQTNHITVVRVDLRSTLNNTPLIRMYQQGGTAEAVYANLQISASTPGFNLGITELRCDKATHTWSLVQSAYKPSPALILSFGFELPINRPLYILDATVDYELDDSIST